MQRLICHVDDSAGVRFTGEDEGLRYKNSIHSWIKRTEHKYAVRYNYLSKQPQFSAKERETLVNWLLILQVEFKLLPETLFITVGEERIEGTAEEDVDRTTADGKASSVQFIHFAFTDAQAAAFKSGDKPVMLGISHPAYPHSTTLNANQVAALAADFD